MVGAAVQSSLSADRWILIVEDDTDVAETMQAALESAGHLTRIAPNGRRALELLASLPRPRLILVDLMMPVMNGVELLAALRGDPNLADIPAVVVSAYQHLAAGQGAAGYIVKPFELRTLLDTVRRYGDPAGG
jgi:CheY-like chemotaxis protein